ncbi:MAG: HAD hydrolase family protein [Nitrospinae bacterium]|nr:HAD hydrolase family protein [Nitrospinota bacterium]
MKSGVPSRSILGKIKLLVFDFDGVMTDNGVYVFEDGREAVRCDRSDGMGVSRLRKAGFAMFVLSTEENRVVDARARKLKIPCAHGVADKLSELKKAAAERGISLAEMAFVGNDINDSECLDAVGLPIVVADAQKEVRRAKYYATRSPGGRGAVREVCDWFYHGVVKGKKK